MASQTPGILRWVSSIKNSMINDPGRQFFEDQVQSQGFLFLEEYLDNIWSSAKQDSFVDLVKTPGRKRASPQKARQAVTAHPISKSLSDEEDVFRCDDLKLSSPPPHTTTTQSSEPIVVDSPPQIRPSPSAVIEKTEVAPQPLPSIPSAPSMFVDMSVPLKEEDTSASGGIARNSSLSQFPSLAAPSPLRKSLRNPREPSLEPSLTATPGTGLTGNYTSWLAKVREAKAIEVTNKRASVAPTFVTPSAGLKRKSDQVPGGLPDDGDDDEERKAKVPKRSADISEASHHLEQQPPVACAPQVPATYVRAAKSADDITTMEIDPETDMMAPLKKAIETLRARTGKSLAGNPTEIYGQEPSPVDLEIATSKVIDDALPQPHALRPSFSAPIPTHKAAAAAAAKDIILTSTPPKASKANQASEPITIPPPREESRRLSVSDLLPKQDRSHASRTSSHEISISTTPPDSPPAAKKTAFFVPGGPVFNKPPPVFVPPPATKPETSLASAVSNVPKGHASESSSYSLGAPFGLGLQPTKLPRSPPRNPLSAQSTQSSLFSDNVFGSHNDAFAGVPCSQDTQITSQESQPVVEEGQPADIDDDDSWRIDDKFAETNQLWTPFVGVAAVEDSMTWSTNPSESQIGKKSPRQDPIEDTIDVAGRSHQSQVVADESDEDMDVDDDDDGEVKDDVLKEGKPTVSLVMTNPDATKSQLSMASSIGESSQPVGFFGHATKLVSSMLGVSKKSKLEPPKSIQLAAAAAKKQQEEQDRKAARLKEMEARRQAVLQKKVEGVKVKAGEEERKVREDTERRKKGREENTGKRPLVRTDSKLAEEDNTRKRKTTVEVPKVKPPSREKRDAPVTRITKPGQIANSKTTTVTKQPSTSSLNQTTTVKAPPAEKSFVKPAPIPASDKGKSRMIADPEDRQPKKAKQSQSQSQSVVPAHPERPKTEPPIPSEMIELPEPNSEYSDSEDEGGQRKPEAPEWTQSPELRAALESQSKVNPDDIFGPVRPLRMEDIFRTRTSRFRARTSSANWSGPDGLKQEEEREYAKRMGFQ